MDTIGHLVKIIIGIIPHLVMGNGEKFIVYKYWLLRVLWLKLRLPRWSPERSIYQGKWNGLFLIFVHVMFVRAFQIHRCTTDWGRGGYKDVRVLHAVWYSSDYHTANDALSHGKRCTITRPSSSKTKTYHVTRSKPMKRQNICKGCYNIKHCEKQLPLKWRYFQERSNFRRIWFRDLRFRIWGLEIKQLKTNNFVYQWCFFFHYYLATSTTNWAQIFTGLL